MKLKLENYTINQKMSALLFTIAIGVIARFFVMTMGHNFDFESYKVVGEIVGRGGNVYAETSRYNYGFIFSLIQGFGYKLASLVNAEAVDIVYRVYIISILTLADIGISCWIYRNYSLKEALIFFLNPISIIITGYHNQFDNIAVLFALIAISYVDEESKQIKKVDIIAILMLTLSLMTKHILFIFFGWIFFKRLDKEFLIKKICYVFIPPLVFLVSFIPYVYNNSAALNGVINNVFLYRSYNNYPIFSPIFRLRPIRTELLFLIYILIMIILGFLFRYKKMKDLLMLYLVAMVAFSSAIANQYLIIPIAALVVSKRKIYLFVYELIGLIYCLLNGNELHLASKFLYHFPSLEKVLEILSDEGGWMITLMAIVLALVLVENLYTEIKNPRQNKK